MRFVEAIKICFSKFFVFNGRARRSEYWWFCFFTFLLNFVARLIDGLIGFQSVILSEFEALLKLGMFLLNTLLGMVLIIVWLKDFGVVGATVGFITLMPLVSVQVRRLHDTGRSGWWISIFPILLFIIGFLMVTTDVTSSYNFGRGVAPFIIISGILILVFLCLDSQEDGNKYGPNPKDDSITSVFD